MSLGAIAAGVDVRFAVELNGKAARTYMANHPGVQCYVGDIRSYVPPSRDVFEGEELIVLGGPPCQGFSTSNQRTRTRSNPNNWLFLELLRVVHALEPAWVVVENVSGLLQTEDGLFLHEIRSQLEATGYTVSWGVLNAADFGVPQRRSRLFVIGSRDGHAEVLPAPRRAEPICVWDALSDLPLLDNGAAVCRLPYRTEPPSDYARHRRGGLAECCNHLVTRNAPHIIERYQHVPQGGNWEHIPPNLMSNYADRSGCHTGIYHRLIAEEPAKVIGNFRKNMLVHPFEHRGLSIREAARLQSFPDSFTFYGSIGFQQQQVGNAVPPLLAEAVFQSVLQVTGGGRSDTSVHCPTAA